MMNTSNEMIMQIFQQNSDRGDLIQVRDIQYDSAPESIAVPFCSSVSIPSYSELFGQNWMELFGQRWVGFGSVFAINEHLMMPSAVGGLYERCYVDFVRRTWEAKNSSPIPKEDIPCIGGLVFVPIRDISYSTAIREIKEYIKKVGNRKVYISELAEELQIDIDIIKDVMKKIQSPQE